jgi:hypothetical protein
MSAEGAALGANIFLTSSHALQLDVAWQASFSA